MSELPPHSLDEAQPILIADAEAGNASHVERQLRRAGVKNPFVTFENGDDLNSYLMSAAQKEGAKPCILFLDPHMPGANGYDPIRWVRRELSLSELKVVIFSSTNTPEEIERAAELGVNLFVKKHPDLSSLSKIAGHLFVPPTAEPPGVTAAVAVPVK